MVRAIAFVTALALPAVAAAQQPCTTDARHVVNELYRTMLERSADRGADGFVQRLSTGQATVRDIVRDIAISPEHTQRFVAQGSADALQQSANNLYRHVLGRPGDPDGLQAHAEGLRTQGVAAVVDSMINSDEYRQSFADSGIPGTQLRFCGAVAGTSGRAGARFRNMDTNGDGRITRSEWRGSAQTFTANDVNRDGVLTAGELRDNALDRPVGTSGTNATADFDVLDRNANGRIERNEWTGSASSFEQLDTNGNNLLSRAELSAYESDNASSDFRTLDANRDGRLTIQEWNWSRRSFDLQDANGDGIITAREFQGTPER